MDAIRIVCKKTTINRPNNSHSIVRQTDKMNVTLVITFLSIAGIAAAHMEMSWPYPLRSKFDPENDPSVTDYSITNLLNSDSG
jgi:hypothetical protein